MADPIPLQSPLQRFGLAGRAASSTAGTGPGAGVMAAERAFLSHLNLRGESSDPRFAQALRDASGLELPVAPNTVAEARGATLYWLGPDEWLRVAGREHSAATEAALRAAFAGLHAAVTDVSGGQTVVVLRGDAVRATLAKGCPLDLDPRVFRVGACAQSHLAKAPILIRPIGPGSAFEIIVRRSFAEYFWLWLEDAAAEYGFAVTT